MARRFRFRLQTLLRVRQLREREAKRKVAAQRAALARLDRLDEQTAAEIARQQAALRADQQQPRVDPLALQRGRAWIAYLRRTLAQRQVQRTELQQQLRELLERLRAARVQARTIEKLRERRLREHARARGRREQAASDELAQQLHGQAPG